MHGKQEIQQRKKKRSIHCVKNSNHSVFHLHSSSLFRTKTNPFPILGAIRNNNDWKIRFYIALLCRCLEQKVQILLKVPLKIHKKLKL